MKNSTFSTWLLSFVLCVGVAFGQVTSPANRVVTRTAAPSPCSAGQIWANTTTNTYQICPGGTAADIASSAGTPPGGNANTIQFNNTTFGGISQWTTTNGTTNITGSATAVLDLSALSIANLKFPTGKLAIDQLENPGANKAFTMLDKTLNYNFGNYGSGFAFAISSSGSSTGTGPLFEVSSGASTTQKPIGIYAQGTLNGIEMDSNGALAPVGTGSITASKVAGTTAYPYFASATNTPATDTVYADARYATGADACAKQATANGTAVSGKIGLDVFGTSAITNSGIACAGNPFASNAAGRQWFAAGTYGASVPWIMTSGSLFGIGATPNGGTIVQAQSGFNSSNCTTGFTASTAVDPCVVLQLGTLTTGTKIFGAGFQNIRADCNSIDGCVGNANFTGNEQTFFERTSGRNSPTANFLIGGGTTLSQNGGMVNDFNATFPTAGAAAASQVTITAVSAVQIGSTAVGVATATYNTATALLPSPYKHIKISSIANGAGGNVYNGDYQICSFAEDTNCQNPTATTFTYKFPWVGAGNVSGQTGTGNIYPWNVLLTPLAGMHPFTNGTFTGVSGSASLIPIGMELAGTGPNVTGVHCESHTVCADIGSVLPTLAVELRNASFQTGVTTGVNISNQFGTPKGVWIQGLYTGGGQAPATTNSLVDVGNGNTITTANNALVQLYTLDGGGSPFGILDPQDAAKGIYIFGGNVTGRASSANTFQLSAASGQGLFNYLKLPETTCPAGAANNSFICVPSSGGFTNRPVFIPNAGSTTGIVGITTAGSANQLAKLTANGIDIAGDTTLSDDGTTLTYSGTSVSVPSLSATSGTFPNLDLTEMAAGACVAGHDYLWGDSTAHRLKGCANGGSATNILTGLDNISAIASSTSAQLAGVLSDELGSGKAVFATALQGTDANVMTSGTVSGTGSLLCTDANGGATTSGCSTGATTLNGVTAATGNATLANGDNAIVWNFAQTTSGRQSFTFGETTASASAGTPNLVNIQTLATSNANPLVVTALGTANGIQVTKAGFLSSKGTGGADSNLLRCDVTTTTKCIQDVLSGITAANTRSITWPDASLTVVGTATSQTLTNKTLTSPVISSISNTGTITIPTTTGTLTETIASGTSAMGTSAISSGACATVVTTSATGTLTTDPINWGFNGDPTGVTGYAPSANGMLTIIAYPSADNVNFKVCNNTGSSITPGAITLNWRILR